MNDDFDAPIYSNKRWLDNLSDIIKQAAEKAGITEKDGRELIDEYIIRLRQLFEDARVPTIQIPMFGTFQAELLQVRKRMNWPLTFFKKGTLPKYMVKNRVRRYWELYKRKVQEKFSKHLNTFDWNFIDPEKLKVKQKENITTTLCKEYYDLDAFEWLDWIKSEPRFPKKITSVIRVIYVINSFRNRLEFYDGIKLDEQTLPAKGLIAPKRAGRFPDQMEKYVRVGFSIISETFCFETNTIEKDTYDEQKRNNYFIR